MRGRAIGCRAAPAFVVKGHPQVRALPVCRGSNRLLRHVDQKDAALADAGEGGAEERDVVQHLFARIGGIVLRPARAQPVE